MIDNTVTKLGTVISDEMQRYLTETVQVSEGHEYSQAKLVRRISMFENKIYPTGKIDSQGNYKYWYDIITARVESEIKNIDFDTKDVSIYCKLKDYAVAVLIANLKLKQFLKDTGQAEEINSAIEEGAGWGNVVWKKVKKSYERVDLLNFYVINQTAKCLKDTPVIERHQLTSSDMRAKMDVWENVKDAMEGCKSETYQTEIGTQAQNTTLPYYEVYERHGEVCLKDLKETNSEILADGDEDKYVFARVIGIGEKGTLTGTSIKYILFAQELKGKTNEDIFEEYHRSRYKGRWFREGLYELLMDIQVRVNQIGNQIAQGLEFASKKVLFSSDKLIIQNIMSDMKNGDVIRASDLRSVDFRMDGFDQLVGEYNRLIQLANDIANSREVVQGDSLPSGTTLGAYNLLNANANKLFVFIREKLAIPLSRIFERWIVPELIADLKAQDILRLTGDSEILGRLQEMIVEDWYVNNLVAIGPHDKAIADILKQEKLQELKSRPELLMSGIKELFDGFKPSVYVDISGEALNLDAELQTLSTFVAMEGDPVRRTALIEMMMKKKNIDVSDLPKSPPPQAVPSPIQPQALSVKQ